MDPREIFPEEVWNLILDCVEDPQDIQSCSNTCTLFRNRLSPTRTTWAYSLIFPSLMKFLPKNDVLKCRLVSKDWLKGVGNFLQSETFSSTIVQLLRNHKEHSNNSFLTRISTDQRRGVSIDINLAPENQVGIDLGQPRNMLEEFIDRQNRNYHQQLGLLFRNAAGLGEFRGRNQDLARGIHIPLLPQIREPRQTDCQKFMLSFEDNPEKNPFLSRAVVLTITDTTVENTISLLNIFGGYIWSLKICLKMSAMRNFRVLQFVWRILKLVPNLKHLLIEELPGHVNITHPGDNEDFNTFLANNPTPILQQLKWIETEIKCLTIQNIFEKAYLSQSVTIFEQNGYIKPTQLTNEWRHLEFVVRKVALRLDWNLHIRSFKLLNLPLESIELQYFKCYDFETIFVSLSKYGSTLSRLKLTFSNLKNVELVEMKKQVNTIFYSFLSKMKCLENFNMIVDCGASGRKIEFCRFVDAILDADWIDSYLEMGGMINGFRRFGFACISAGLRMKVDGSSKLKRKYFTDGKYFRSMEIGQYENN